ADCAGSDSSCTSSDSTLNSCPENTLAQLRGALGGCPTVTASYEAAQEAFRNYRSKRVCTPPNSWTSS
ncbi:hypothetical protein FHG87_001153, partial [Trinorchestia longiramus]